MRRSLPVFIKKKMLLLPNTKKQIINWVVAITIPSIVIPLVACLSDYGLSNSFLIVGAAYIAYVVLWALGRAGMFDLFAYQFTNWSYSFRKNSPKKYEDLTEYREVKTVKRRSSKPAWLPYIIIGSALIITAIIIWAVQYYIDQPVDPSAAEEIENLIRSL